MTSSANLQKEIVSGFGLAAGIYSIAHGVLAKEFAFRSKAWKPVEEKVAFEPSWKDRLLIVFAGVCVAAVSLYSLVAELKRH